MIKPGIILAALLLGACGEEQAPAPTAEQAEQLNQAEELLNEQALEEQRATPGR